MNPLIVFDTREVVTDPFALTLAAAARARALRQGAEPRVDADVGPGPGPDLALAEIASGAFAKEELALVLPYASRVPRLEPPKPRLEIGDGRRPAVAAPVPAEGTVH